MKSNFSKFFLMTLAFATLLFLNSCNKDENDEITSESAQKSAQMDAASDEVDAIIEDTYMQQEGITGRMAAAPQSSLPSCATVNVVLSGMTRTVTLTFADNCEMPNGNILSGVITIVYEHNPTALSRTITFTYNNFTFNGIALSGGGNVVRVLSNSNGNPQSTANVDITASFPNGGSAHRTGTRVREWIAGFGTPVWTDNEFKVTGNWETEFANGDVNSGLVTTPLIRKATCPFFVSGVVQLSHNDFVGSLDYGDGTCDNVALFTGPNGNQHTIHLGQ